MATEIKMVQNDTNSSTILTIRMIMQGKEVGSIIGKKGDNIKKFREDSGAKINISDGSCPERIVTITGSTDNIHKAFTMICKKFEEDLQNTPTVPKPPVTLRLVVPASQCGSLIGKGGCKIKEIRESTGASIQVASEMLPNSTERAVTISGTADAITQCIRNICGIMLESPPKGANIPYRPKPVVSPVILAGGQAYTLQSQMAPVPSPECPPLTRGLRPQVAAQNALDIFAAAGKPVDNRTPLTTPWLRNLTDTDFPTFNGFNGLGQMSKMAAAPHMAMAAHPVPMIPTAQTVLPGGCVAMNGLTTLHFARPNNNQHAAAAAAAAAMPNNQQTHEMTIPNDLIGCIIGRGGQKINEIRQLSGANIKISNAEEGSADRKVTISGAPETIGLAQYLINTSMEMHKTLTLDPTSTPTTSSLTSVQSHAPLAIPLSQLIPKPVPMLGLNMGVLDASADRKNLMPKMRVGVAANTLKKAERPKFAPY